MKFIDEAKIEIIAGDGGNGCVSFRREKFVPRGGPDGGDGGNGGSIFFEAKEGMTTLLDVQYRKKVQAKHGEHGKGQKMFGRKSEDIIVFVPAGTLVFDMTDKKLLVDLKETGQNFLVAKGGKGGRGNARYVSSTRQAPRIAQKGVPGERKIVRLELKLLADVGLIGFPNAGKSTLISAISNARPKIADYPFTTKVPHLGVVKIDREKSFVVADIPGLIEGAHKGHGMGIQFLRHIERTRILLHLIDVTDVSHPDPLVAYESIRQELNAYDASLLQKPEVVVLTKMDIPEALERGEELKSDLEKMGKEVFLISAAKNAGLKELVYELALR